MSATDQEQIQSLLAKYCFVTDRGTAEEMAALFWDDAVVKFGDNRNEGIEAVTDGFAAWIRKMRDPVEGLRHVLHTPCIEISGHSRNKGRRISLRGLYRDRLEKRNGEWRFAAKEIQIWRSMLESG